MFNMRSNKEACLIMKRNIARVAFWCLFFIELFVASAVIGAFFEVSSDVDSGSIIVLLILALVFAGGSFFLYRTYDPFKEKYYFAHETPLRFHKFFCYVSLPLGILLTMKSAFDIFSAEDFPANSFYFIDLAYAISSLTLMCICFAGLRKLKSYAWYALMINYLVGVLYLFTVVIIHIIFSPFFLDSSLASLMIYIYVAAIICLYYYKRKALFLSPNRINNLGSPSYSENSPQISEGVSKTVFIEMPEIAFCRICGYKLEKGSHFCSRCGTAIVKE